jgi:tetratricopeptide (TPR) repeat protein
MILHKSLFRSSRSLRLAREHFEAKRFDDARALCHTLLGSDPKNIEVLQLLGRLELRLGNAPEAIEVVRHAVAINPSVSETHCILGDAYLSLGDLALARACFHKATSLDPNSSLAHNSLGIADAIANQPSKAEQCFRDAIRLDPGWALPHFNLGLSLKDQRRIGAAVTEFRAAWQMDLLMSCAMHEFVTTTAEWAREAPEYRAPLMERAYDGATSFSIIFCSIDEGKCRRTRSLYERLFEGYHVELIAIRDASSLAEAYNRGIAQSSGEIVVLSHDDIEILAPNFAVCLLSHLKHFDVVGVMGATQMTGPSWNWSRHPYLRGWITHRDSSANEWRPLIVHPARVSGEIVVLDGVFIAARRHVFTKVKFDDELFDGFHLYDTDWSYRAAVEGYRLATAGDLMVVHASRGNYDDVWRKYAQRFCVKHLGDELLAPPPLDLAEASLMNVDEVCAFFGRLCDVDTEASNARCVHA